MTTIAQVFLQARRHSFHPISGVNALTYRLVAMLKQKKMFVVAKFIYLLLFINFTLGITGVRAVESCDVIDGVVCWSAGLRPERPMRCSDDCWQLMERCWDGDASSRPHIGELEQALRSIYHDSSALPQVLAAAAAAMERDDFVNVNGHSFAASTFQDTWSVLQ